MDSRNGETENPYILKRRGKFGRALKTYADKCKKAHIDGDEFIAQVCFDQMVDVKLRSSEEKQESNPSDLKHEVSLHLKKVIREHEILDGRFHGTLTIRGRSSAE